MHTYTAYGLTVDSEFELPELPAVDGAADVVIRRGGVTPVAATADGLEGRHVHAEPDACRLTYDGVGSFRVEAGERIRCDPLTEAVPERDSFRRLLENELFGLLLHQRGQLVVHASAVAVDGRAVVFLGPSGAGKSTVAAAMQLRGHSLLEDDVVGVRFESGTPTVVPGVPQLRLRPDAAAALDLTDRSTPSSEPWDAKRFVDVAPVPEAVSLSRCYVLREGQAVAVEPYAGTDTLFELVARTHARGLLGETARTRAHFRQCADVAAQCEFRVLERPADTAALPAVADAVTTDLREGAGG